MVQMSDRETDELVMVNTGSKSVRLLMAPILKIGKIISGKVFQKAVPGF